MKILIADDTRTNLRLLDRMVRKWGYETILAKDGLQAWQIFQQEKIAFVISDWLMPELDGPGLCRHIRSAERSYYTYLILVTAQDDKEVLIQGLEAGADDFLTKPVNYGELQVRVKAGIRVLALESALAAKHAELESAYSKLRLDLEAAADMQLSLIPAAREFPLPAQHCASKIRLDWLFCPSAFVAGDTLNFFNLDEHQLGFYLLDVSGHGVPAAMFSITLSKLLSPLLGQGSPLKSACREAPFYQIPPPQEVFADLNNRFQMDDENNLYFTMVYGLLDTRNGHLQLAQAGHPYPIYLQSGCHSTLIGEGGVPIGMVPDMDYDVVELDMKSGDRLVLYSDGVTENMNPQREEYSTERFQHFLEAQAGNPPAEVLAGLGTEVRQWRGVSDLSDDVSVLMLSLD